MTRSAEWTFSVVFRFEDLPMLAMFVLLLSLELVYWLCVISSKIVMGT